jgi:hypothetical protein
VALGEKKQRRLLELLRRNTQDAEHEKEITMPHLM